MGRSVAVIVALLVMFSASTVAGTLAYGAAGAPVGSVAVDITAPSQDEFLLTSYALITWDVEDPGSIVNNYEVFLDNSSAPITTAQREVNLTGLSEGKHTVEVWALNQTVDQKVRVGHASVIFFIDAIAPTLSITSPANEAYLNHSAVTIAWQLSDSMNVAYFGIQLDEEAAISPLAYDKRSHTFSGLDDGPHTVTVVSHSWGGQTTSDAVSFSIDTTYPSVNITSPEEGEGFDQGEVAVHWTGTDAGGNIQYYEVWVDGVYSTDAAPTATHFTQEYTDGEHTVRIVAVDIANSTAADEVTFIVDTVAPVIVAIQPLTGSNMVPTDGFVVVYFNKPMDRQATYVNVSGVTGSVVWSEDGAEARFLPSSDLSYGTTYTVTVEARDMIGTLVTSTCSFTTTDVGSIAGKVIDNNGNPLSGVTVTMDGQANMVTDASGRFEFYPHAGSHNLTFSKAGWDGRTVMAATQPGQALELGNLDLKPSNPLAIYGIIAAIIGVVIVAVLIYMSRFKKKGSGPAARSWKGMEELQKRASKDKRHRDEEEEEEDTL